MQRYVGPAEGVALLHIRARFCRFLRKNVHFCLFYSGFPLSLLTCCGSSRTAIRGNRRPFPPACRGCR